VICSAKPYHDAIAMLSASRGPTREAISAHKKHGVCTTRQSRAALWHVTIGIHPTAIATHQPHKKATITQKRQYTQLTYNLSEARLRVVFLDSLSVRLGVKKEGTHCPLWLVGILTTEIRKVRQIPAQSCQTIHNGSKHYQESHLPFLCAFFTSLYFFLFFLFVLLFFLFLVRHVVVVRCHGDAVLVNSEKIQRTLLGDLCEETDQVNLPDEDLSRCIPTALHTK